MNDVSNWLGKSGYLPHGYCFSWDPALLWTMVASDSFIAAAYFSIPLTLLYFVRRRRDVPLKGVAWMFSIFIFSCGSTHVLDVWTIWQPVYDLQAASKLITAAASMVTATVLWMLMPRALKIPSVRQLQAVIDSRDQEIAERLVVERSLLEARNDLSATLAALDAGIIACDRQGRLLQMNAVAERVTGWLQSEALGRPLTEVWRPDGRQGEPVDPSRLLPRTTTERLTAVSRAGEHTAIEVSYSSTLSSDGAIRGLVMVFRDMTRLDRADTQSRQWAVIAAENRQIVEANRVKNAFLANMSHELRTPLNSIIGFAGLLAMGLEKPGSGRYEEFVAYISDGGKHLLRLINEILDLSKVEAGKMAFYPEPVDVASFLTNAADQLAPLAQKAGVHIEVSVDPGLSDVVLDSGRLMQVLYNYASNGLKFTPPGGRLTIRALPHSESAWRLEVADTGRGIAQEDLPRLFIDFQQLVSDFTKRHEGAGLGLALTRRLVEAQGGTVGVHSVPGAGSTFYAVLPYDGTAGVSASTSTDSRPVESLPLLRPES